MEESLLSKKKLFFSQGSNYFRQRLVLSLLSARPVHISEIRSQSPFQVGVTDYEVSFVRLLDKLSNGSKIKISETGTEVTLIPGTLAGGTISHVCAESRPLSYYLEPVLLLAPFFKKPLRLTLKGRIQNNDGAVGYNSVYKLKHAAFPLMETFGIEPDLQIKSRSFEESEVLFTSTVKKQLLTLRNQLNQESGKVKKIRGLVYGFRVSPQMLNRVITAAKGVFLPFINDVFITSDAVKNSKSKHPGYGLVLYAETTRNIVYATDGFIGREELEKSNEHSLMNPLSNTNLTPAGVKGQKKRAFSLFPDDDDDDNHDNYIEGSSAKNPKKMRKLMDDGDTKSTNSSLTTTAKSYAKSPEELGIEISKLLLSEIATESRVDSVFQWLVLGFMTLGPKDVTSVVMGPLTPFTVQFLRDVKTFFGVTFKIEDYFDSLKNGNVDEDDEDRSKRKKLYKMSCLGTGYINLNKTMV